MKKIIYNNFTKFFLDYFIRKYYIKSNYYFNLNIFSKFNIFKKDIKKNLLKIDMEIFDCKLSWHFHFCAGLSSISEERIDILEIGTANGNFAKFLSKLINVNKIYTIDLPDNDERFINSYNRETPEKLNLFLNMRKKNLDSEKINFIMMDSKNIIEKFENKKFDLIWVDGDHLNPQVTIDIMNSLKLIKNKGYILCDDIIMENEKNFKQSNSDSYKTIESLKESKMINVRYILKRLRFNKFKKKYIAIINKN